MLRGRRHRSYGAEADKAAGAVSRDVSGHAASTVYRKLKLQLTQWEASAGAGAAGAATRHIEMHAAGAATRHIVMNAAAGEMRASATTTATTTAARKSHWELAGQATGTVTGEGRGRQAASAVALRSKTVTR